MNKRRTKPTQEEQEKKETLTVLEKNDFNHIKFTHSQLNFFKTIKKNFLTVCTGPAGTAKTFEPEHGKNGR